MNKLSMESASITSRQSAGTRRKRGPAIFLLFVAIWALLIGGGVYGAKVYIEQMQRQLTADIERQTAAQISELQLAYSTQIEQLETNYMADIALLQGKIDALNELLTFTKDNADDKTDNSNQLYTQLNDVKKQLNELKKSLDVLK